MKKQTMKRAVAYPTIAGIALLSLTQCASDEEGTPEEDAVSVESSPEQQQLISERIDEMHESIKDVEVDIEDEAVTDIIENEADSEYYPDLQEAFETVAEEYFSTENLDADEMFELNLTLAILNDTLSLAESEDLPVVAPLEHIEIEGEEATAYIVFTEDELTEEDYEQSEDFDNYQEYVDFSIENEQSDVVEMVQEDGEWVVVFF